MNLKLIRALAQIVEESKLGSLEVSEGDFHVKIEGAAPAPVMQVVSAEQAVLPPAQLGNNPAPALAEAVLEEKGLDFKDLHILKSYMVGVFYQASGPGEEPYVKIGQRVKKGDVLCIIEAMKLMNEIVSERDGEIVDICVSDGEVVEYGQPLFKLF